ncbi:MAG: hypothetical protein ABR597_02175 [Bacteroidales bacterium]
MKIPELRYIFLVLVLFLLQPTIKAQQITSSIEPQKIFIGEPVQLVFDIKYPDSLQLEMPVFNENINSVIEILHHGQTDSLEAVEQNQKHLIRSLTVTSWEEGFHPIEPITFLFISGTDTLETESEPLLLEVEEFLIDEHTELKGIKAIMSAPVTFREVLPWALAGIALILLITAIILYLRKRKPVEKPTTIWEKPDIPAHIAAISSLEKLKARKLWQQGKIKEYYSELTDILRHYIEKRFNINAMEMTSSEIMESFRSGQISEESDEILRECLQLADLVKFAKHYPESQENEKSLESAFEIVNLTRVKKEENNNNN